jgi:hypothetical protein
MRPMKEFGQSAPALMHDRLNDRTFEWSPASRQANYRRYGGEVAPGVIEWDGLQFGRLANLSSLVSPRPSRRSPRHNDIEIGTRRASSRHVFTHIAKFGLLRPAVALRTAIASRECLSNDLCYSGGAEKSGGLHKWRLRPAARTNTDSDYTQCRLAHIRNVKNQQDGFSPHRLYRCGAQCAGTRHHNH